jgi:membrane protein required for beta-lactamase induction
MIMISIVISMAMEMFSTWASQHRHYRWADTLASTLKKILGDGSFWHSPWGVIAVLFVPLLILGLLQSLLNNVWLSVVELLLSVAVLLYCLRYQPMATQVDELVAALQNNDQQKAQLMADAILETPAAEVNIEQISGTLLVNANERLFAVLVWFAILGPLGALLYRLSWYYSEASLHASGDFGQTMHRLHALLNWLPARLLASSYAVVGSFEDTLHGWREVYRHPPEDRDAMNHAIMLSAGSHSMHLPSYRQERADGSTGMDVKAIEAAHGLVLRSMLAWGIVIAVLTLVGWTS